MSTCPVCEMGANCSIGPGIPRPGDRTVCLYCSSVLEFTDGMDLKLYRTVDQLNSEEREIILDLVSKVKKIMNRDFN
jgi:hypothetical protein